VLLDFFNFLRYYRRFFPLCLKFGFVTCVLFIPTNSIHVQQPVTNCYTRCMEYSDKNIPSNLAVKTRTTKEFLTATCP
jgi:hypothetical protein